jgi:hypothetical protein
MATADFTIADVLAWARTKPADERYSYIDNTGCALCIFLRETHRAERPHVVPDFWYEERTAERHKYPYILNLAVQSLWIGGTTFGGLVRRLEVISSHYNELCALVAGGMCTEEFAARFEALLAEPRASEWTKLDAYLADIEAVSESAQ